LELAAEKVQQRYFQNFLALPARELQRETCVTRLQLDQDGGLSDFAPERLARVASLRSPQAPALLQKLVRWRPGMFANLKIKKFPTRALSVAKLRGYLQQLEATGFVTEVLLLDYVGLMDIDAKNYRIALGQTLQDLRGLAEERNLMLVSAQQVNREGLKARQIDISHVGEDWSIVQTADFVFSLSRNEVEKRHKLARLAINKNRDEADGFGAVLSQNYEHGQFVLESAPLQLAQYEELLQDLAGREAVEGRAAAAAAGG
jgi:hypothetical protein